MNLAHDITSVWTIASQSDGSATKKGTQVETRYVRHSKEKEIMELRAIEIERLGLKVLIPQLPFLGKTVVKVSLDDAGRGVLDHYVFLSSDDLAAPCAATVFTELPANMKNHKAAFGAVVDMQSGYAREAGIELVLTESDSFYGPVLHLVVPNRRGSQMFPTSNHKMGSASGRPDTMGLSRFALVQGILVEWSLIVPMDGVEGSPKEMLRHAGECMAGFWENLESM